MPRSRPGPGERLCWALPASSSRRRTRTITITPRWWPSSNRPVVQAASLSNATSNGTWSAGNLNASGREAIDKTGTTQLRVYFNLDDNDDNGNDHIGYYSGNDTTSGNRPQLVVTYQ